MRCEGEFATDKSSESDPLRIGCFTVGSEIGEGGVLSWKEWI